MQRKQTGRGTKLMLRHAAVPEQRGPCGFAKSALGARHGRDCRNATPRACRRRLHRRQPPFGDTRKVGSAPDDGKWVGGWTARICGHARGTRNGDGCLDANCVTKRPRDYLAGRVTAISGTRRRRDDDALQRRPTASRESDLSNPWRFVGVACRALDKWQRPTIGMAG
ncbi:uncharacterized protein B0H64DRAFT_3119 [Chaetomium fimeti]|uniref:Uncharacterized protein n=1 Tax=Chaetomium fimeti TaxID=1854472 RepID=A0AAE0HNT1_9PEZI|nr:hypothetical protein B0H64DRAFT_3119 [Chaetomium fimeti]